MWARPFYDAGQELRPPYPREYLVHATCSLLFPPEDMAPFRTHRLFAMETFLPILIATKRRDNYYLAPYLFSRIFTFVLDFYVRFWVYVL